MKPGRAGWAEVTQTSHAGPSLSIPPGGLPHRGLVLAKQNVSMSRLPENVSVLFLSTCGEPDDKAVFFFSLSSIYANRTVAQLLPWTPTTRDSPNGGWLVSWTLPGLGAANRSPVLLTKCSGTHQPKDREWEQVCRALEMCSLSWRPPWRSGRQSCLRGQPALGSSTLHPPLGRKAYQDEIS